jgi:hypothetical protein
MVQHLSPSIQSLPLPLRPLLCLWRRRSLPLERRPRPKALHWNPLLLPWIRRHQWPRAAFYGRLARYLVGPRCRGLQGIADYGGDGTVGSGCPGRVFI